MNMIDFLAIVPFYLSLLLEGLEDFEIIGKAGKIIRLVKVGTSFVFCIFVFLSFFLFFSLSFIFLCLFLFVFCLYFVLVVFKVSAIQSVGDHKGGYRAVRAAKN